MRLFSWLIIEVTQSHSKCPKRGGGGSMVQELSKEEALNEIDFIRSLQIINQMKSVGLIDQVEFNKIQVSLIERYKPYLAELML